MKTRKKNKIILEIEKQIDEFGHRIPQNQIDSYKNNRDKISVIQELYTSIKDKTAVYEERELDLLEKLQIPESIIEFYTIYSEKLYFNLYGDIWFLPIEELVIENTVRAPGAFTVKYGVVTIGVTTGGNAIAIDLNKITDGQPRVLLVDHSIINSKEVFCPGIELRTKPLSYSVIDEFSKEICETFWGFLEMLKERVFDDIEDLF